MGTINGNDQTDAQDIQGKGDEDETKGRSAAGHKGPHP